jgi:DNA-binding GntR family transcriptional regulator
MGCVGLRLPESERKKIGEEVYTLLRNGILSSKYESGVRLSLEDIARDLGTSLLLVRKAVQQLASEGLVEVRPRSGSYVANLTTAEVEELCDIRRSLECLAAETAVRRITPDQLTQFRALVEEMSLPVQSEQQRDEHEAKNTELHRLLVRASGNGRLVETYENLKVDIQIARLQALRRLDWKRRLPEECKEHQEMLASLVDGDADRLINVLRQHIERAKAAMVLALQGRWA